MSKRRSRGLSSASSLLSCARTARSIRRDKPARTAPFEGNASRKSASDTPAALQMSRIEISSKRCSEASSINASTILPRASAGLASLFALLATGTLLGCVFASMYVLQRPPPSVAGRKEDSPKWPVSRAPCAFGASKRRYRALHPAISAARAHAAAAARTIRSSRAPSP